jgi:TolB-like protein
MPAPHVGQVTPPVEDPTAAPPRRQPRRPWVTGAVAVVVLIAALIAFRRVRPDSSVDDDLLAVAPFSLFGADTVWREGLTDVLVRNLDGAGSLRTVSTATSLQHWNGYSDPTSAENLGRALRSRFVVFGSVMRAGRDSVRVTAAVMDVRERHALPALQWTDASTHMDRLSDSVTLGMLRQIGQQLGVRSLNHIPLGSTTTLAALKEFLQGERYFRRTAWDSAFASYKRATELDSTFALALWRAGVVAWWRGPDEESNDFKRRAGAHNHGLGPRDSLLIAADYLFADADSTTDELRKWNLVRQMHATLAETVRRYPNDAEVWFAQGDALFHFPPPPAGSLPARCSRSFSTPLPSTPRSRRRISTPSRWHSSSATTRRRGARSTRISRCNRVTIQRTRCGCSVRFWIMASKHQNRSAPSPMPHWTDWRPRIRSPHSGQTPPNCR